MRVVVFLYIIVSGLAPLGCEETKRVKGPAISMVTSKPTDKTLLFIGDSLTSGFGVAPDEAFTSHIDKYFRQKKLGYQIRNAGVSGDTTSGVLRRLDWLLTEDVATIVLAIGANDGLRGIKIDLSEKNIETLITKIRKKNIRLILCGMKLPPNYGPEYANAFAALFPRLAQKHQLIFYPFLLAGVAGHPAFNQPDGIHPNAQGHQRIAQNLLTFFSQKGLFP